MNYGYKRVIGKRAFQKASVKEVVLGNGVAEIRKEAFRKCGKLKKIKIKSRMLNKVGKKAIWHKAKVCVPKKKLKKYKKLFKQSKAIVKS